MLALLLVPICNLARLCEPCSFYLFYLQNNTFSQKKEPEETGS